MKSQTDRAVRAIKQGLKWPSRERGRRMPTDSQMYGFNDLGNGNKWLMAALMAYTQGMAPDKIVKTLKTFKGVEHRNEFVRELDGVKWYNDSIGSSPTRTIAGLLSFKQKVILIAGGYDKHLDYTELGEYIVDHVSTLILLGQTKEKIKNATLTAIEVREEDVELPLIECTTLEEAVNAAQKYAKSGDIVFFSPASASFDLYKNFMERGNHFKELVGNL